ncbi:nucleotidyltransferase family protein [Paralimibaculum aggregatum]|uniref:Nucleotidyltransferase family protein n=1 Tax=Paralimibaculum aggregatum TaxID=3036245 RepID=A0ABQ6LPR2_9RHOB|nr:nucleotidyltransferase family protein [Limibaculum sp. NKW23]GMG82913.1 nucleotidyltransferase family protein [Limibaculum sp. NKW23]
MSEAGALRAAMVLSAGFGTRMRPLTEHMPKAMVPVAGRALVDRALDRVAEAGIPRAVVNLHYMGAMLRSHLAGRASPEIAFSEEQPEILDTGGGIRQALPMLGAAPFFAVNSDAVWAGANPLDRLRAAWGGEPACLLLVPRERARGYTRAGDFFLAPGGHLARRGSAESAPYVYTGAQILSPEAFEGTGPGAFSLNPVWDRLIAEGRLRGVVYDGLWADVGTPAGIAAAEAALTEAGQ